MFLQQFLLLARYFYDFFVYLVFHAIFSFTRIVFCLSKTDTIRQCVSKFWCKSINKSQPVGFAKMNLIIFFRKNFTLTCFVFIFFEILFNFLKTVNESFITINFVNICCFSDQLNNKGLCHFCLIG